MAREASLPPAFDRFRDAVRYVQQVSDTEYSSSCPTCGGQAHPGGEWPDRCRWFTDGKPRGWCRRCGSLFWPDADAKPDPEALARWRKEQEEREQARKRSAERALANLAEHRIWERYHAQMDEHARFLWRKRGVCDSLQDFWQLGYDKAHRFWRDGHEFETATLAIPIFGDAWQPLNIKHRLIDPPVDYSKYRYELIGVTDGLLWRADPDSELTGHVIAIEGEIKAMVTAERAGTAVGTIVGLPGTHPSPAIVQQLRQADRVTLVMDPGAKRDGVRLANALGIDRCWMLSLPHKIDDGILAANLSSREVMMMLRSAVRLSAYVTGAKHGK
jgi:hypothetical protein